MALDTADPGSAGGPGRSVNGVSRLSCILLLACVTTSVGAQDRSAGEHKHGYCASCHGLNGQSFKPHYPILAGQSENYLLAQLTQFKDGQRHDPSMNAVAPQLSLQDMRDLAAFFASVEPHPARFKSDAKKAAQGKTQAAKAGCATCHSRKRNFASASSPRIAGQQHDYLAKQLRDFRAGRRIDANGVMRRIAQSLTDAEIDELSDYFAGMR